ncbi:MAG: DNA polymerase III subunit gamma/tau [Gemmataceae bacterium]|nr:DNA polymerase III subunit gamma/tau [Gemmataceae bacterium]
MAKRKPAAAETPDSPPPEVHGYTVLARRYRPQAFADLVGQEPVAQALANALQTGRVAHAYLFTGARGVGKTSTARILAKSLNCVNGPTATPCNQCDSCVSIAGGDDVDVLEIDGASNRGIDEVREIRQNVQFRPTRSKYKIYIIDEVHMLTAPAFNALLKTLEEPPAHVKFIFATTEVQKIPVTILSRCQRFDFAGIGTVRIVERLRQIVASEGMQAADDALELVARRAGGSMRDAQSLLDQLLAFGEDRLTADHVHRLLGTANEDRVADLAAAVLAHDAKRALELLTGAADEGIQPGEILDQLIDYWRDLMVAASCGGAEGLTLGVSGKQRAALAEQARGTKLDTLLAGLDVLVGAKARARGTSHGRVLLEMAIVRLCRLEDLVPLAQLTQWLAHGQAAAPAARPGQPATAVAPAAAARLTLPPEGAKKKPLNGTDGAAATHPVLTPETLPDVWAQILGQLGRPFLAADLGQANSVAISGPNALVIRFATSYTQQCNRCQEPAQVKFLEQKFREVTGQTWNLRFEVLSTVGDPAASSAHGAEDSETSLARSRRQKEAALQAPLLKRAVDVLGAQIVQMDDGFGAVAPPSGLRADRPDGEDS